MENVAAQYNTQGFVIVKDSLDTAQLLQARSLFENAFKEELWKLAPHSSPHILNDVYHYFPQVLPWLISPKLIAAVRAILGPEAVWLPECSVHRNRYIGWHKDTSIQMRGGLKSHMLEETPMIQCAIYLQDNDPLTGGGLTVIKGSHKRPDRFSAMFTENLAARIAYKALKMAGNSAFDYADRNPQKLDIPSRLGDVVLFDVRTDHRATRPQSNNSIVPDKLAVFNTFGMDSPALRDYFQFMKQRPEPYYQYYRESPLPQAVREWAAQLNLAVWY